MEWIWYFFLYSAAGFLIEVAYARLMGLKKRDRKCLLLLPLCPVYGVGALGIFLLPEPVLRAPLLLVPAAAAVAVGAEYLMALFYEKVWRVAFWDYRAMPFHLQGRVCLPFAAAWGLLALPLVYGVQPLARRLAPLLPPELLAGLTALFLADCVCTGALLRRRGDTDALRWYRTVPLWLRARAARRRSPPDAPARRPAGGQRSESA